MQHIAGKKLTAKAKPQQQNKAIWRIIIVSVNNTEKIPAHFPAGVFLLHSLKQRKTKTHPELLTKLACNTKF